MSILTSLRRFLFIARKTLSIALVLTIFTAYWSLTLLYVSPNNPLRAQMPGTMVIFEYLAYQRWTFFAPPPTERSKLYYIFTDSKGNLLTYEVTQQVDDEQRRSGVYDEGSRVVSYVLNGSVDSIIESIQAKKDELSVTSHDQEKDLDAYLDQSMTVNTTDLPPVITLWRYSKMVAARNGLHGNFTVSIVATRASIPKFKDRYLEGAAASKLYPEQLSLIIRPFKLKV